MGLDWNPANKAIPGLEAEYEELRAALENEAESDEDSEENEGKESEASRKFFEASISAFDTLNVPTIGIDEIANQWAKENYAEADSEEPYEEWFEKVRGLRIVHLVPPCPGVPRYSNGSPGGYVEPFSFRAKFLHLSEGIISEEVLESCYENREPAELIEFGKYLKNIAEEYAAENQIAMPPTSEEFDENSLEWQVDIVLAAGEWCIYWGERGHPLHAYW